MTKSCECPICGSSAQCACYRSVIDGPSRYWTFSGSKYYPSGGMDDYKASFDTIPEAKAFIKGSFGESHSEWAHIYDFATGTIAERFNT